jgi:hypothetical protein
MCWANTRITLLTPLLLVPQWACSQKDIAPMTSSTPLPADAVLKHRFRGVYGAELRVDATFQVHTAVIINVDTGYLFNIGMGTFSPRSNSVSGYGGSRDGDRLGIPKHLRMIRYPDGAKFLGREKFPYFEGTPVVDVTVPIAERIPDEVLDDVRQNGGGLRLKLRIAPETLLVGWDVVRRPGYNPANRDSSGAPIFVPAQYSFIGGDFCERQVWEVLVNGRFQRIVKKGWYIDLKTGQRIETDY